MFSGLVQTTGKITKLSQADQTIDLIVSPTKSDFLLEIKVGDSVAVNGTCLTVTKTATDSFAVTLMPQTFVKTTFKKCEVGTLLNLERSLQVGSRLEGHIVSGHIDEVSTVISKVQNENAIELKFALPQRLVGQIIPQGSVAINGVSLTVMDTGTDWFTVGLIPHTQAVTNLDLLEVGDQVNLETDVLGKYVVANLRK